MRYFSHQYERKGQCERKRQNYRREPEVEHKPLHQARRYWPGASGFEVTTGVEMRVVTKSLMHGSYPSSHICQALIVYEGLKRWHRNTGMTLDDAEQLEVAYVRFVTIKEFIR